MRTPDGREFDKRVGNAFGHRSIRASARSSGGPNGAPAMDGRGAISPGAPQAKSVLHALTIRGPCRMMNWSLRSVLHPCKTSYLAKVDSGDCTDRAELTGRDGRGARIFMQPLCFRLILDRIALWISDRSLVTSRYLCDAKRRTASKVEYVGTRRSFSS
jgi:hypothetical protein